MSIICLSNVSYRVGSKKILDRVSWQLDPGQHWAILGANGAGKTTLLKIACGYLWPDLGEVTRLGQTLLDLRELRTSIGWVTHDLQATIPPNESSLDTVVSGRFAQLGLKRQLMKDELSASVMAEAMGELDAMGAQHLGSQAFGTLSQGERQKVLIARARMAKPLVVFLDEPCSGLDPGARENLLASLEQLANQSSKISLVMVTHHVEEITPSFGNLLALAKGQVVGCGDTSQLLSAELMESIYDVKPPQLIQNDGRVWPIW